MPATIYAGTVNGAFKSSDAGSTWTAINSGLAIGGAFRPITALVVDPKLPATVYAGTDGSGVFRSADDGTSWTGLNIGLTNLSVHALAVDPTTGSTVHAGTAAGVFDLTPCTNARCTVDSALGSPMCAGERIPAGVTRGFHRGAHLIDRAARNPRRQTRKWRKRVKQIFAQAKKTASRAAKGRTRKISDDCAAALEMTVDQVVSGLAG